MPKTLTPGSNEDHRIDDDYDDKFNHRTPIKPDTDTGEQGNPSLDGSHESTGVSAEDRAAEAERLENEVYGDNTVEDTEVPEEETSFFNEEADSGKTKGSLRARLQARKKWLWIGGAGGGSIAIVLLFALLLFSGLKLPNLTENILAYQFSRISRYYSQAARKLTDEAYAKQAARQVKDSRTERVVKNLRDRAAGSGKIPGLLDKVSDVNDRFNPAQVQANLKSIGLETGVDGAGNPRLSISGDLAAQLGIHDQSILYQQPSGVGRFIPGYRSYLKLQANQDILNKLQAALDTSYDRGLRLHDVSTFARTKALNDILKELGITRSGFIISKFAGKSDPAKAFAELQRQAADDTEPKKPHISSDVSPIDDSTQTAADEQAAAEKQAASDPKAAATLSEDGSGMAPKAVTAIQHSVTENAYNKILGFINGASIQVAFLACVFDDAATSSNQSIDNGNDSNQRNFVLLSSASQQQERGPSSNDQVGAFDAGLSAMNQKAGNDTEQSIPLQRAMGASVDTSSEQAAQSSALGFQSAKDAISTQSNLLWTFMVAAKPTCSAVTNVYVQGAIALGTVASYFVGAGELKAAGDETVKVASESYIKRLVDGVTTKFTEKLGVQALKAGAKSTAKAPIKTLKGSFVKNKKLFGSFLLNGAAVVGTELLGAYVGSQHASNVTHSGYTSGNTWVNEADAGGNANAQDLCRKMQFCRPLTKDEVCQNNQDDVAFRDANFKAESSFQRYFATSNSQSLLSKSVITVGSEFDGPASKPLRSFSTMLTKPTGFFSSLLGLLSHKAYAINAANCDADTANYGNVQFGWSDAEEALIKSDPSYAPDENLAILGDASNPDTAAAIANKYAKCFGYKVDPSDPSGISQDPAASIGNLLGVQDGDLGKTPAIVRDERGNVSIDRGLCAPNNLSFDTADPDFRGKDASPDTKNTNDLVFRWRLANRYSNTQNQLVSYQNPVADGTSSDNTDGAAASGSTQALAQQVLAKSADGTITLSAADKSDIEAASKGQKVTPGPIGDGSSGLPGCDARTPTLVSGELLKVMLAIAAKYHYQSNGIVSGHDCDTGQHVKGRAIDIYYINGKPLNDAWWSSSDNVATINDIADIVHGVGDYTFGFGVGCTADSKIQSHGNLTVFNDSCHPQDEIHVDVRGAP